MLVKWGLARQLNSDWRPGASSHQSLFSLRVIKVAAGNNCPCVTRGTSLAGKEPVSTCLWAALPHLNIPTLSSDSCYHCTRRLGQKSHHSRCSSSLQIPVIQVQHVRLWSPVVGIHTHPSPQWLISFAFKVVSIILHKHCMTPAPSSQLQSKECSWTVTSDVGPAYLGWENCGREERAILHRALLWSTMHGLPVSLQHDYVCPADWDTSCCKVVQYYKWTMPLACWSSDIQAPAHTPFLAKPVPVVDNTGHGRNGWWWLWPLTSVCHKCMQGCVVGRILKCAWAEKWAAQTSFGDELHHLKEKKKWLALFFVGGEARVWKSSPGQWDGRCIFPVALSPASITSFLRSSPLKVKSGLICGPGGELTPRHAEFQEVNRHLCCLSVLVTCSMSCDLWYFLVLHLGWKGQNALWKHIVRLAAVRYLGLQENVFNGVAIHCVPP